MHNIHSMYKYAVPLTHRFAVPPLPHAGEGWCRLVFSFSSNGSLCDNYSCSGGVPAAVLCFQ
ncbi:MAG: hypothetical protein ACRD2G_10730, partial [Terriglobia bacterium]